jgi:hypothetical protein
VLVSTAGWVGSLPCQKASEASCELACVRPSFYGLEAGTEETGSWDGVDK